MDGSRENAYTMVIEAHIAEFTVVRLSWFRFMDDEPASATQS